MTAQRELYHEPYRPQIHFSPPRGWMNDPNGLVYYQGEYHLFYQFSPEISRGPMHWGHAVSSDGVHWQTLAVALEPDAIGAIWSGTVVVDDQNSSGLVPGGGLVAVYSYENQSQGVAFSTDRGRTWTKYAQNPVIAALAQDFRDPKIFWDHGQWVMVLAVGRQAQLFTSPNLLDWQYRSSFSGGHNQVIWEMPDLFPMQFDGQTVWVLMVSVSALAPAGGGGTQYFIGSFDGQTFRSDPSDTILWLDYGPDDYAGTTWNNLPDGQRVYIGWMSSWPYAAAIPTSPWRGAATLPHEFKLVRTAAGLRLAQSPLAALRPLRSLIGTWDNLKVSVQLPLDPVRGRVLEIIAEFEPDSAARFGIDVHRGADHQTRIVYDSQQAELVMVRPSSGVSGDIPNFSTSFGAPISLDDKDDNRLRLQVFVDDSSVEVFAQDGLVILSGQTFANPDDQGVALFAEGGTVTVRHLEIYSLASIWPSGSGDSPQL